MKFTYRYPTVNLKLHNPAIRRFTVAQLKEGMGGRIFAKAVSVAGVCIALTGAACAPITSIPPSMTKNVVGEKGMRGFSYFLPQPIVRLQVWKTDTLRDVTTETKVRREAPPEDVPLEEAPTVGADGIPVKPNKPVKPALQTETTTKVTTKEIAGSVYSIQIGKTTFVPDETQPYMVRYHPSILSDDEINIKVGSDGLLTKVKTTTDDKTDDVIIKLIDTAKELSKSGLFGEENKSGESTIVYEADFNPLTECDKLNLELRRFGVSVGLERLGSAGKAYEEAFPPVSGEKFSGVAFRPMLPYMLNCNGSKGAGQQRLALMLPDPARICTFPIGRAAFVKKVTDLNFDHGVLTEVTVNKPSEALAFMEIPLSIAKALTEIPANIVQVKIDQTKQDASLAAEQKKLLDNQKALLDAQAAAAAEAAAAAKKAPDAPHPQ